MLYVVFINVYHKQLSNNLISREGQFLINWVQEDKEKKQEF